MFLPCSKKSQWLPFKSKTKQVMSVSELKGQTTSSVMTDACVGSALKTEAIKEI